MAVKIGIGTPLLINNPQNQEAVNALMSMPTYNEDGYSQAQLESDLRNINKKRRPMTFEWLKCPYHSDDLTHADNKGEWQSITLYINPERLEMQTQKIKGKMVTRKGIFYHHWGDDHWTMNLSGTTGLSGMEGIRQLETAYLASGKLLAYPVSQSINAVHLDGGLVYDTGVFANGANVGADIPRLNNTNYNITQIRANIIGIVNKIILAFRNEFAGTSAVEYLNNFKLIYEDYMNKKVRNKDPNSIDAYQLFHEVKTEFTWKKANDNYKDEIVKISDIVIYKYLHDELNSKLPNDFELKVLSPDARYRYNVGSAEIKKLQDQLDIELNKLNDANGEPEVKMSQEDMNAINKCVETLIGLSRQSSEIKNDLIKYEEMINEVNRYMLNEAKRLLSEKEYFNKVREIIGTKFPQFVKMADLIAYHQTSQNYPGGVSSHFSATILGSIARHDYNLGSNEMAEQQKKLTELINGIKTTSVVEKSLINIGKNSSKMVIDYLEYFNVLSEKDRKARNALKGVVTASNIFNDLSDPWKPRKVFCYFENCLYIGHFDSFSYSRSADNHLLVRYQMRFTVEHQLYTIS